MEMSSRSREPRKRRFVDVDVAWLGSSPAASELGMTAFRPNEGVEGLFSVFVKFRNKDSGTQAWKQARVYALTPNMQFKLPPKGEVLILASGNAPLANYVVTNVAEEDS
jgi:hypothetical protein